MTKNSIVDPTEIDANRYAALNKTIIAGLTTFLEVGSAFAEIKGRRLYRVEFETWDDFLKKKHGLTRQHASRLIKAKEVVSELEEKMLPIGNISRLPNNEAQVRPLFRLKSPEERSRAWINAVEAAGENQPTAEVVSQEVRAMLPEVVKSRIKKVSREPTSQVGDRETESAVLHDGSQVPDSLWVEGYIDSGTAQRKLDEIGNQPALKPEEKLSLQKLFIDLVAGLNTLHEEHPTKEMRKGILSLFQLILPNLHLVVSKPGDWESPSDQSE